MDRPVVFHSYVSKSVSILRDDSVQVDRSDPDVKSQHGVLIYGNSVTAPFIPKYLSICVETTMESQEKYYEYRRDYEKCKYHEYRKK